MQAVGRDEELSLNRPWEDGSLGWCCAERMGSSGDRIMRGSRTVSTREVTEEKLERLDLGRQVVVQVATTCCLNAASTGRTDDEVEGMEESQLIERGTMETEEERDL